MAHQIPNILKEGDDYFWIQVPQSCAFIPRVPPKLPRDMPLSLPADFDHRTWRSLRKRLNPLIQSIHKGFHPSFISFITIVIIGIILGSFAHDDYTFLMVLYSIIMLACALFLILTFFIARNDCKIDHEIKSILSQDPYCKIRSKGGELFGLKYHTMYTGLTIKSKTPGRLVVISRVCRDVEDPKDLKSETFQQEA